jgi:hypothetical protein
MDCDTDGREEKCFTTIVEKCEETKLERVGVDGKIISKWVLKKQGRGVWIGFIFLRTGARFRTL